MKKYTLLLVTLFFGIFSLSIQAQDFYVCDSGSDENDGKSESKPFKSFEKAVMTFRGMSAGSNMKFCRGGVFQFQYTKKFFNHNCTAEKKCSLTDYGDSDKPNPILHYTGTHAAIWMNDGPNHKADGGYIVENMTLISDSYKATGILMSEDVNDVIIQNVHIEKFGVGVFSAGTNANNPESNRKNNRITLKNSMIVNNSMSGWLGGCDDCLIHKNKFINNGFNGPTRYHNIYIESPTRSQEHGNKNITVTDNYLYKSAIVDGKCSGTSLVVHGIIENLKIKNNVLEEDKGKVNGNCWGIQISPGNELDEYYAGVEIAYNKIINLGNTGIACSSCVDAKIHNNLIIDEGDVLRFGISVPNKKTEDSVKSKNISIYSNRIALNHPESEAIRLGGENQFSARNNTLSINEYHSRSRCFVLFEANIATDVTNNTCNDHSEVSYKKIIDDSSAIEVSPEIHDSPDETSDVREADTQLESQLPLVSRPITSTNQIEKVVNDNLTTETDIDDNFIPSNGSSSGGSSTGRSINTTEQNTEILQQGDDSLTHMNSLIQQEVNIQSDSLNVEQIIDTNIETSATNNSPTTNRSTSNEHGIKLQDVYNAGNQDYSNIDPADCRAYARGKCLLR